MALHVAMLTMSAYGHVNPFLPIAAEHRRRGDRVTFAVGERFADEVRATGATLLPYGSDLIARVGKPEPPAAAARARFAMLREELRDGIARLLATEPHVVIYDSLLQIMGGPEVSEMPLPRVALSPTFAFPDGITVQELFRHMAVPAHDGLRESAIAAFIAESTAAFRAEPVTLVTIPRSYQPDGDAFDARYRFIGPSLRDEAVGDFPLPPADGRPRVFVSLGTVAWDQPEFYRAVFAALAERDWQAVVSTGRTDPATIGPAPANVIARPHVPQLAVLRQSDVFVSHGGMNSTMESLRLGVPLVVAPRMADQFRNAERVQELGLGRSLAHVEQTPATLLAAIDAVLADDAYRQRVAAMQIEMVAAGGATAAVDAVHEFMEAGVGV
ncbi:MAG TPA: macrolide family glycosyltransferase [Thermomicrobiales bacterium]|nr:macrolide family glycosyltransferase [Thermomicrobiales bacterium]